MFIIKFNKMIRNKWLWGAFAIIVAGAFILSDSMISSRSVNDNGIGKLNGKSVDPQEFNTVARFVDLNRLFTDRRGRRSLQLSDVYCLTVERFVTN